MLQRVLGCSHFKLSPDCPSNICRYSKISVRKFCTSTIASVCKFSNQRIMQLARETPSVGEMHFVFSHQQFKPFFCKQTQTLLFRQHELRPYRLPGPFVNEGNLTPDCYLHFLQDEVISSRNATIQVILKHTAAERLRFA